MPYIKQHDRDALETGARKPDNAGELNYAFTLYALSYLQRKGAKYQHINDVIGALEGAKLEFYRRFAAPYEDTKIAEFYRRFGAPYEDTKIAENGDVYDKEVA